MLFTRLCEPKMLTRPCPLITYCHSSALGCQCNSRIAPGSMFMRRAVKVFCIGNSREETTLVYPPLNSCLTPSTSMRNLCEEELIGILGSILRGFGSTAILPLPIYNSFLGKE